jgi:tetratricopeptide (TPR) repeat protein
LDNQKNVIQNEGEHKLNLTLTQIQKDDTHFSIIDRSLATTNNQETTNNQNTMTIYPQPTIKSKVSTLIPSAMKKFARADKQVQPTSSSRTLFKFQFQLSSVTEKYWNHLMSVLNSTQHNFQKHAEELGIFQDRSNVLVIKNELHTSITQDKHSPFYYLLRYALLDLDYRTQIEDITLIIEELNSNIVNIETKYSRNLQVLLYNMRAAAYMDTQQWNESLEDLSLVIRLMPTFSIALHRRGTIYITLQKQLDLALEDFRASKQINPNNLDAYLMTAYIYYKQNKSEEAIAELSKCIGARHPHAFYLRSQCYLSQNKTLKAYGDARRAYELKGCIEYIAKHYSKVREMIEMM